MERDCIDEIVWIHPRVESDELGAHDRSRDEVIDSGRPCRERRSRAGRELHAPQASVAVSAARKRQRLQRFAFRKSIGGQSVVDVVNSSGALGRAVAQLHADAAHLVAVPAHRDDPRVGRIGCQVDLASSGRNIPDGARCEPWPLDDGLGRRRPDDEGERVDEIVGIDPGVKSDQLRAFDRKRGLMVEAVGSGVERVLERRLELDLTQAAVAVSGISEPRADKRFARDEAILGERVFGVVISAGLFERAVAELHSDAAHLVAIPSDADEGHDRFI